MNQGKYCRIHFRVKAKTLLGQTVGIGGSVSTLGNFDTKKLIHLVTTPDSYPVWYTLEPIVVPRGRQVSYSYCIIEGGNFKAYEATTSHRTIVPNNVDILVEETFDTFQLINTTSDSEDLLPALSDIAAMRDTDSVDSLASLDSMAERTIYITCYHLPVTIKRIQSDNGQASFDATWNHSLISMRGDETIFYTLNKYWVGTVSVPGNPLSDSEKEELTRVLAAMKCIPLFFDPALVQDAYYRYCKQILWPTFHNVEHLDHMHAVWATEPLTKAADLETAVTNFWSVDRDVRCYEAYQAMNRAFADKLVSISNVGDIVWVHDYHLFLLPGMLRDVRPISKIIFFLHIPFPTSQVFRSLPTALSILRSVCESDVIGFHTFDYARHFLHATRRMLGSRSHTLPGGLLAVTVKSRELVISMSHVSIEPAVLTQTLHEPDTVKMINKWKTKLQGKKVFVCVDTCQRLSGCLLKLEAFRMFLEDSHHRSKYCLVMCTVRPNLRPEDEEYTSNELKAMADALNAKYGSRVVEYFERDHSSLDERVALWTVGDVFLLTSIREGLNLMPLEYIYCRKDLPDAGVVVASEFSACSSLLNGSMKINPFNFRNVADVLHRAVNMSLKDKESRRQRDLKFVQTHTSAQWTNQILTDLGSKESLSAPGRHDNKCAHMHRRNKQGQSCTQHEIMESMPLHIPYVISAYENALLTRGLTNTGSRVFILDYGGTLIAHEKVDIYMKQSMYSVAGREPSPAVMSALKKLSEDENNSIMIITSLTRKKLGSVFDDLDNVTIAASNGLVCSWGRGVLSMEERIEASAQSCCVSVSSEGDSELDSGEESQEDVNHIFRSREGFKNEDEEDRPRSSDVAPVVTPRSPRGTESFNWTRPQGDSFCAGRVWDQMDLSIDWDAVKSIAIPIMTKFTTRTNGTYMTSRAPGIGWSYFGADPEWGEKQVVQLRIELETALVNYDVRVVSLPASLEIVPRIVHKGVIVTEYLRRIAAIRASKLPSFVLVAGNEPNDNKMFDAVYGEISKSRPQDGIDTCAAFSVHIGKSDDHTAGTYLPSVEEMKDLLTTLANSPSTETQVTVTETPLRE
mmetsp:Transcript_7739/g.11490  ORF Transcript_7739/g.11490 Transcript_7739/m.11490 type:complete len:1082 (+) Transcript_7739:42-3287(+)